MCVHYCYHHSFSYSLKDTDDAAVDELSTHFPFPTTEREQDSGVGVAGIILVVEVNATYRGKRKRLPSPVILTA